MNKPKPEDYGYQNADSFDIESGWMIEGGEEAYYEALEKWNKENKPPTAPDWSTAPEWAQWFAVNRSGYGAWYECAPDRGGVCWWPNINIPKSLSAGKIEAGNYEDWKNSLQERPTQ